VNLKEKEKLVFKEKRDMFFFVFFKKKPISQFLPIYLDKQSQLKFPFNLVEHCAPFKHRANGQLESKFFVVLSPKSQKKKKKKKKKCLSTTLGLCI